VNPDVDRRLAGLMQRALGGDETAYAVFLREVAAVVRRTARGRLAPGIGIDPEDIVQETLLAIHLKRHTWQPDSLIGPWVHAITPIRFTPTTRLHMSGSVCTKKPNSS
jgi:RNA polymerase sigma-70 factor (ECF subfamily)